MKDKIINRFTAKLLEKLLKMTQILKNILRKVLNPDFTNRSNILYLYRHKQQTKLVRYNWNKYLFCTGSGANK